MTLETIKPLKQNELNLVVIKFGSSILSSISEIPKAVHEVYQYLRQGYKVLVIVSAIGNTTDELINATQQLLDDPHAGPPSHIFAELLATGEVAAASFFSVALDKAGIQSGKLNHLCLKTCGPTLDAEPYDLQCEHILNLFEQYPVLVLPGFTGCAQDSSITLLGRVGSDLTAIFAAWRLNAKQCILYKDTHGIYDRDPNAYGKEANPYKTITYEDCLKLASSVIQHKALKFAQAENFTFTVKALAHADGTLVGAKQSRLLNETTNPPKIKVSLLGLGTVGWGVYKHLSAANQFFDIVGIGVKDCSKHQHHPIPKELISDDLGEIISRECDVVVELIGGTELSAQLINEALKQKKHVITANKALIAEKGLHLSQLASYHNVKLSYSAAVAGAVPILETLKHLQKNQPKNYVKSITGILNGTCNFILDKIREGKSFSDAIKLAQIVGIAEHDPSLDISGQDAAQKIIIISRLAFGREPDVINVQGIQTLQEKFIRDEAAKGNLVRLIASCTVEQDNIHAEIKPISLHKMHPLASVPAANNAITIQTIQDEIIQLNGKGAGRWPTAQAVYADLLELLSVNIRDKSHESLDTVSTV